MDLDHVEDSERISRYLADRSKFAATTRRIKHNAFVPPANRKLSTYRTDSLQESEVWNLAKEYVEPDLGKTVLARGDLPAGEFTRMNLLFHPDRTPHERHCNVVNWPESDWLKIATDLANAADLVMRPEKSN